MCVSLSLCVCYNSAFLLPPSVAVIQTTTKIKIKGKEVEVEKRDRQREKVRDRKT